MGITSIKGLVAVKKAKAGSEEQRTHARRRKQETERRDEKHVAEEEEVDGINIYAAESCW